MKHWITKKKILLVSLVGAVIVGTRGSSLWCNQNDWGCRDQNDNISILFLIFIPALFISLITYKMHDKVFYAWRNFAFFWIPFSIIMTAITPDTSGFLQVIDKEFVAEILSALFVIISLILITYKHFTLKKG